MGKIIFFLLMIVLGGIVYSLHEIAMGLKAIATKETRVSKFYNVLTVLLIATIVYLLLKQFG